MPRTLTQTLARIRSENPTRGAQLQRFYEKMRGTLTLEMLETGSWRRAIEILDQYLSTGYRLSKYAGVIDIYESWVSEYDSTGERE